MSGGMPVARWLAEVLAAYGVTHVFFVPEVASPAMAAMEDVGIVRVSAHSEVSAAYMADGYARAGGRPAVCLAQAVGAMNQAAGLREPFLGCSPVISITGGPEPNSRYRFLYQQVEDLPAFDPVTKLNVRVEATSRFPDLVRSAFRVATSGCPGPVHLEIPGRLGEALQGEIEVSPSAETRFAAIPPHRPAADAESVARALDLLAGAERPVIIAGGGTLASGAGPELVELAERLGIPVATSLNGRGAIPDDHPLALGLTGSYGRWSANETVADADLVLFVGSRAGGMTTDNWRAPRIGSRIVQLDIDPAIIGLNYPVETALVGDARTVLRQLLSASSARTGTNREWSERVRGRSAAWRAQIEPVATSDAVPIRPERLCRELSRWLPAEAVVVADTGHIAQWSGSLMDLRPGQRYLRCAGTLGWGLPGAIGAKCALPDRPVVCLTGDGGIYYHLAELETAARQGINVVVVINDNGGLSQTRADYDSAHGRTDYRTTELWRYQDVDFARIAEEFGCLGTRVTRPEGIGPALSAALAADRPAVIDVRTDPAALPLKPWS